MEVDQLADQFNQIQLDNTATVIRLYNDSDQRPFTIPATLSTSDISNDYQFFTQLIAYGYDLDLTNYPNLIRAAAHYGDFDAVEKLIPAYPPGTSLDVNLDYPPVIVAIMSERFNLTTFLNSDNLNYIPLIMNMVTNIKKPILIDTITIPSTDNISLLRSYFNICNIPVTIKPSLRTEGPVMIDIDQVTNQSEDIVMDDRLILLNTAINEGRYQLAKRTVAMITNEDNLIDKLIIYTLVGQACILTIQQQYPQLIADNRVQDEFIKLVNMDYDLEYCISDELAIYWDDIDLHKITNHNAISQLRPGSIHTCDYMLAMIRDRLSVQGEVEAYSWTTNIIDICLSTISNPDNRFINDDNVLYLIGLLYDPSIDMRDRDDPTRLPLSNQWDNNTTNNKIMNLLIVLHQQRLIDIRQYADRHTYIEFIAQNMHDPRNRLKRVVDRSRL